MAQGTFEIRKGFFEYGLWHCENIAGEKYAQSEKGTWMVYSRGPLEKAEPHESERLQHAYGAYYGCEFDYTAAACPRKDAQNGTFSSNQNQKGTNSSNPNMSIGFLVNSDNPVTKSGQNKPKEDKSVIKKDDVTNKRKSTTNSSTFYDQKDSSNLLPLRIPSDVSKQETLGLSPNGNSTPKAPNCKAHGKKQIQEEEELQLNPKSQNTNKVQQQRPKVEAYSSAPPNDNSWCQYWSSPSKGTTCDHVNNRPLVQQKQENEQDKGFFDTFTGLFNRIRSKNDKVVSQLKVVLKEGYSEDDSWSKHFPTVFNIISVSPIHVFDILTVTKMNNRGMTPEITSEIITPVEPGIKILVTADPGFGKTTLCNFLAYQWTFGKYPLSVFELCLWIPCATLKPIEHNSAAMGNYIVRHCTRLANSNDKEDDVQKAFASISDKIFILLDGFDEATEKVQDTIFDFLIWNTTFQKSTVLVTTRPGPNEDFRRVFYRHVHIRGFSLERLDYLLSFIYPNKQQQVTKSSRLSYLTGMSPLFMSYVLQVIGEGYLINSTEANLYNVMEKVISFIANENYHANLTEYLSNYEMYFSKLGELFWKSLAKGCSIFQGNVLERILASGNSFIKNTGVFYCGRQKSPGTDSLWHVSSKVWLVFFATHFLRRKLKDCKDLEQMQRFLKKYLCFDDCTGDYIVGSSSDTLYYVGALPEIVVKFRKQFSLESATVEMYYDVDRIECSQAFESVNLLLRLNERLLGRFGFERKDPNHFSDAFENALRILSAGDAVFNFNFFYNKYEEQFFVKAVLEGNAQNDIVLTAVLKTVAEGIVNRVYIDFKFASLEAVFEPVRKLLCLCLEGFDLSESCKNHPLGDFLFTLVVQLYISRSSRLMFVSCGGESNSGLQLLSFQIIYNKERKTHEISFSNQSNFLHENDTYEFSNFMSARDYIINKCDLFHGIVTDPTICLNLM